jgi:AcrR family transcriptional regulator
MPEALQPWVTERAEGTPPTIARILRAAEQEFAEAGFDAAKMEHIARRAGLSKQLVYHYFGSKKSLYGEVLHAIARANHEALLGIDYENLAPAEAIRAYVECFFAQYYSRPAAAMVTIDQSLHSGAQIRWHQDSSAMHEKLIERLDGAIQRGKAEGTLPPDITVERFEYMMMIIVAGSVSSRAMFTRMTGSRPVEQIGPENWKDYAVSFILKALRPEAAPGPAQPRS